MINSILKAMDILALFSYTEPRLDLATISERLSLPKSTVHNLLQTLMSRGVIEQVEKGSYAIGTALLVLCQSARVNVELRDRAAPMLRELADVCHESAYLTVREGDWVLYIYAIESRHRLLARSAIGDKALLHCTSNGKAILAHFSEIEIAEYARRTGLPSFTPYTITSLDCLRDEMKQAQALGYAIDRQEHELNTYCVGTPIFDASARTIGGCSISGSDPEIIGARLPLLVEHLKYFAQEISRHMGYVPAIPSQVTYLTKEQETRF